MERKEEVVDCYHRIPVYLHSLLVALTTVIKHPEYKETDMHQMVHDIIKDIEEEVSNAFLERKEK